MSSLGAHRGASRTTLVLLQLLVFVTYIFGPAVTAATDPTPDPTATESPAPETTEEPAPSAEPEPTEARTEPDPTQAPTPAPEPTPAPDTTAPPDPSPEPADEPASEPDLSANTRPYIVTFVDGTSEARQLEILAEVAATDVSAIPQLNMRSILLHETDYAPQVSALNGHEAVARVDFDRTRESGATASDAAFADQWSLPHVGWTDVYGGVSAPHGSTVVAVLDTGVDASHPDLDGVVQAGTSFVDGADADTDPNGHGTWMAGLVAAETDNGFGVAGAAWAGVSILPVTVLGADGLGQDSDIIEGVVHAADAGADVILMAFSNPGYSPALQAAIDYAWSSGAVLVAAAGNDGVSTNTFPAGDRGVIGVAATDASDALAAPSNHGDSVFLAAPGVSMPTTAAGGGVATISGTSASSALVAGAAAQLRALDPAASNGAIVGRLARNADPTLSEGTGNGRLNMARAAADTSTDSVQPAGASPVGDGGPLVGPYAANAVQSGELTLFESDCVTPKTSYVVGDVICAQGEVTATNPSSANSFRIQWFRNSIAAANLARSTLFEFGSSAVGEVETDSFAPDTAGTWVIVLCRQQDSNSCAPGQRLDTATFSALANTAPVANGQSVHTSEDTAKTITLSGTDANGDDLTFTIVAGPTNGSLGSLGTPTCLVASGTSTCTSAVTYTPNANYNGSDSFTFRVNDGTVNSATATVTITVTAVDDPPVAVDDTATLLEDAGVTTIDVLANDTDIDGGPKSVTSVTQPAAGTGTVAITNSGADVSYTPPADFCGSASFSYTLNDGSTATVNVTVTCVNDAPTANAQTVTVLEDETETVILTGSTGPLNESGQILTFVLRSLPASGELHQSPSGDPITAADLGSDGLVLDDAVLYYTPAANSVVTRSFDFLVRDNGGTANGGVDTSGEVTITLDITPVNDAPSFTKGADQTVDEDAGTQSVSGWATDVSAGPSDESAQSLTFLVSNDNNALFSSQPAISAEGTLSYTPAPDANGSATVTVALKDDGGTANGGVDTSGKQTFTITVTAVDDPPVAVDDTATLLEDAGATTIDVLANDTDIDGGPKSVTSVTQPAAGTGTVAITNSGADVSYTPPADFCGSASFSYTLNDGSTATVNVTVTCVNDAPTATDGNASQSEDAAAITIDLRDLVSDVETGDDDLTYEIVTSPAVEAGTLSATATNGVVSFDSAANFNGQATFTYRVTDRGDPDDCGAPDASCDAAETSETKTVTITVYPVNDRPTADHSPASPVLDEDTSLTISVSGADVETAAAGLTFTITQLPTDGTLANGSTTLAVGDQFTGSPTDLTYTPDANFNGSDGFAFEVTDRGDPDVCGAPSMTCDAAKTSDEHTVSITVTPVNDAPVLAAIGDKSGAEGTAVTFTASATDIEDDNLTYSLQNGATDCAVVSCTIPSGATINASSGVFSWIPADNGTYRLKVVVTDNGDPNLSDFEEITITVANVDPSLNTPSFTYNPYTGSAYATIHFEDPGWADTHGAEFNWSGFTEAGDQVAGEQVQPDATGKFDADHTFSTACVTGAISVTVTDDDGGTRSHTFAEAGSLNRWLATWQAPVKDGMRNVVKHGNVIPLKIKVVDCLGNVVTGRTLSVFVMQGADPGETTDGTEVVATSVSNADPGNTMRYVDSHYMFNFATKGLKVNMPYTIVIRDGGQLVTKAVIDLKK